MAHETGAPLRVALLGCGVVGSAVATRLVENADDLAARVGAKLELVGIAVRRPQRPRPDVPVDPALFTADAEELVTRADIVIEVIGGVEPARSLILRAMQHGASVVSANKALLAEDGPTLYAAADAHDVDLYYEAAVAGAIPILRPIRESLAGDDVRRVLGIVNGTTNFVLDKMDTTGAGFAETVEQAQALGYAEADPTADVEGFDAAAKAAILASLAFHTRVSSLDVHREGITEVTAGDIQAAAEMDCVVKLLAICERVTGADGGAAVSVRVHPAMIPRSHPLASVREAFNAVFVEAAAAGELMFYGRGAGATPRHPPCWATSWRWRATRSPVGAAPGSPPTPTSRSSTWASRSRGTTSASTWPTAPACSPRSPRPSPRTTCRSRPCASRWPPAAASAPSSSSSPTAPRMPPSLPPSTPSPSSMPSTTSHPSCAWKEPEPWRTSGAE